MWFIGVEVEQETIQTNAPPPKKIPGSAPALENKIHIFAPPCNIFYIMLVQDD